MEMPDSVSMTSPGEPFGHQQEKMVLYFTRLTASTRPGYGLTALPFHHSLSAPNSKMQNASAACVRPGATTWLLLVIAMRTTQRKVIRPRS